MHFQAFALAFIQTYGGTMRYIILIQFAIFSLPHNCEMLSKIRTKRNFPKTFRSVAMKPESVSGFVKGFVESKSSSQSFSMTSDV